MKPLVLLFALLGTTKYCSRAPIPAMSLSENHKNRLLQNIHADAQSADSATAAWAKEFQDNIAFEYARYKPDTMSINSLVPLLKNGVSIKIIGGNWCSDTRREVPRLCKVLDACDANPEMFQYFRVNKQKKAISSDFAAEQPVVSVPTVFVYRQGVLKGSIVETPRISWEKHLLQLLY